jgi:mono/diheme cytochrome c family protein
MSRFGVVTWLLLIAGCGPSPRDFYEGAQSRALGAATNQADCATCHSSDGSAAGFNGKSFKDIAFRASYKGGMAKTLLDGANACVTGWMGGVALTEASNEWKLLAEYLESLSNRAVTAPNPLEPEVLADLAAYEAAYAGGNAGAGAARYAASCARCHDQARVVGATAAPPRSKLSTLTAGRIAQQVRTSGPPPSSTAGGRDTTPGPMPFFEPSDLSAADLKDIIAYLRSGT